MTVSGRPSLGRSSTALAVVLLALAPAEAVRYRLVVVGPEPPTQSQTVGTALNDSTRVAGHRGTGGRPWVWDADLGSRSIPFGGQSVIHSARPIAVTDDGAVLGNARPFNGAFDRLYRWIEPEGTRFLLRFERHRCFGNSASGDGRITGLRTVETFDRHLSGVILYEPDRGYTFFDGHYEPYSSQGFGVNRRGDIVGQVTRSSGAPPRWYSFVWTRGQGFTDVLPLAGWDVLAFIDVNDDGLVVGHLRRARNDEAVGWTRDRGLFFLGMPPGVTSFGSNAVNDVGQALLGVNGPFVGTALWSEPTGTVLLRDLLDESARGWKIEVLKAINNKGELVGAAPGPDGVWRAILLTPYTGSSPMAWVRADSGRAAREGASVVASPGASGSVSLAFGGSVGPVPTNLWAEARVTTDRPGRYWVRVELFDPTTGTWDERPARLLELGPKARTVESVARGRVARFLGLDGSVQARLHVWPASPLPGGYSVTLEGTHFEYVSP